ncbi:MAG: DNA-directed RNA polymerase subunit alpha [Gemmatimonadota bacterium]
MPASLDLTGLVLPDVVEERGRSDDGRRAEFLLQPLEQGFGHTLGNSIRRILLSSMPGSAIWAFHAEGVQHQHQTVEGVAEDVHQIIQNLKKIVLRLEEGEDEARLHLAVHEQGVVRASDIEDNASVEIINPDQELFTLQEERSESRPLRMEFWVNRGRGFVTADEHDEPEEAPVNLIRTDSIYNPVRKANFRVDETRVGQRTDFDRLTIEIETDGALDPADAEIARTHLEYFTHFGSPVEVLTGEGDGAGSVTGRRMLPSDVREVLQQDLDEFDEISVRSRNTLDKAEIHTLADVVSRTRDEMLDVQNFGEKSLEEVAEVLADLDLEFGMPLEKDDEGNLYLRENGAGGDGEQEAAEEDEDEA